jgi:hypothetical protein
MRILLSVSILLLLSGCASRAPHGDGQRAPAKSPPNTDLLQLQSALGMDRAATELGLSEKIFDSCHTRVKDGTARCGNRYLSVVNFRLLCRDSEGTVEAVVTNTRPLKSDHVEYQLAGDRGVVQADANGYVQVRVVTAAPVRGQRLVVTVGKQFFGKEVSEVDQLILPTYWCD